MFGTSHHEANYKRSGDPTTQNVYFLKISESLTSLERSREVALDDVIHISNVFTSYDVFPTWETD